MSSLSSPRADPPGQAAAAPAPRLPPSAASLPPRLGGGHGGAEAAEPPSAASPPIAAPDPVAAAVEDSRISGDVVPFVHKSGPSGLAVAAPAPRLPPSAASSSPRLGAGRAGRKPRSHRRRPQAHHPSLPLVQCPRPDRRGGGGISGDVVAVPCVIQATYVCRYSLIHHPYAFGEALVRGVPRADPTGPAADALAPPSAALPSSAAPDPVAAAVEDPSGRCSTVRPLPRRPTAAAPSGRASSGKRRHERNHRVASLEAGSASTRLAASVPFLFCLSQKVCSILYCILQSSVTCTRAAARAEINHSGCSRNQY